MNRTRDFCEAAKVPSRSHASARSRTAPQYRSRFLREASTIGAEIRRAAQPDKLLALPPRLQALSKIPDEVGKDAPKLPARFRESVLNCLQDRMRTASARLQKRAMAETRERNEMEHFGTAPKPTRAYYVQGPTPAAMDDDVAGDSFFTGAAASSSSSAAVDTTANNTNNELRRRENQMLVQKFHSDRDVLRGATQKVMELQGLIQMIGSEMSKHHEVITAIDRDADAATENTKEATKQLETAKERSGMFQVY